MYDEQTEFYRKIFNNVIINNQLYFNLDDVISKLEFNESLENILEPSDIVIKNNIKLIELSTFYVLRFNSRSKLINDKQCEKEREYINSALDEIKYNLLISF